MRRRDHAIAILLFALASAVTWWDVWTTGPGPWSRVALHELSKKREPSLPFDVIHESWLVSRHAHTLIRRPWRLIDTEHCAPAENTLTLGIPMVTLGILAIPGAIVSDEPVFVYNLALVLLGLVSAFAMYRLVAHWTGLAAAGWIAGLMFGFMPVRIGHIGHPSVWDLSWTVFALYFAERFSARGRWRDALGLGLSIALQVAASFYQLLAAVCLALPFVAWLLLRDRLRAVRAGPAALVLGGALLAVLVVLVPYLGAETSRGGMVRESFHYLDPRKLLRPSELEFPGWSVVAAGLVGVLAPARHGSPGIAGDPRWALLVGAALVLIVASGPGHAWLAGFVPGLASIRGVARLVTGVELVWVLLAGLGIGVVVRAAGSRGPWVAAALLGIAALDVLRPPFLGLEPRHRWSLHDIRPDDASIAFFAELERRGNRGPILELPVELPHALILSTERLLLSGYHGRRTSACFGSYAPPNRRVLRTLAGLVPDRHAVNALMDMGFTTVVLDTDPHHSRRKHRLAKMKSATEARNPTLALVYEDEQHAGFQLLRREEAEPGRR